MAHRVYPTEGKNFTINVGVTPAYNADFDGNDNRDKPAIIVDHEPVAPGVIGSVFSFLESDSLTVTIGEVYLRIVMVHSCSDFSRRDVLSPYHF
jgi:hypothetical protein